MKVLLVSTVKLTRNGVTSVIAQYHRALSKCVLFDLVSVETATDELKNEIDVNKGRVFLLKTRRKNPVKYFFQIVKICKEGKYDIIHIHGNSYTMAIELLAAYLCKIPVRIAHGHASACKYGRLSRLMSTLFFKLCNCNLACSQKAGDFLYKGEEFTIIANAFDTEQYRFDRYKREQARNIFNVKENTTVIGYVAVFAPVKNHVFLVDVFCDYLKYCSDSLLVLIGTGVEIERIKAYTKKVGVYEKVLFLGERGDVDVLLNGFDFVLFPSLSEGLGISILEAEANGIPIIANKNGISKTVKVNENFRFLPVDNPIDWVECLKKMPKERDSEGDKHVSDAGFDIGKQAGLLYKLYEEQYEKYRLQNL